MQFLHMSVVKSEDVSVVIITGTLYLNFKGYKIEGILLGHLFQYINMTVVKILEKSKLPSTFFFYSLIAKIIIKKNYSAPKPSISK